MSEQAVGIDLGTTFSVAAAIGPSGKPEVVPNGDGERTTPSVIYIDEANTVYVGQSAYDMAKGGPDRAIQCCKRYMGDPSWCAQIGSHRLTAVDASALILKKIVKDASEMLGSISKAVITVPAYFDEVRRKATMDAASKAGIEVLRIINEPTSAALAYAFVKQLTGRCLVYDFGGGTFDVTVVNIETPESIKALATAGNHKLGGVDLDRLLARELAERFEREHGMELFKDGAECIDEFNARDEAERTKRKLSRVEVAKGVVVRKNDFAHSTSTDIERSMFEEMIEHQVMATDLLIDEVIEDAKLSVGDIDHVLAVGGSSRVPAVLDMLKRKFGKEPLKSISPDEAVALGAAIQAGMILSQQGLLDVAPVAAAPLRNTRLQDVTAHSYGTTALGDRHGQTKLRNCIIIPKNTPFPCEITKSYYTHFDGQDTINCDVTQGEGDDPEFVNQLWWEKLNLPSGRPAEQELKFTFSYDANSRMHCEFLDVASGRHRKIDIDLAGDADSNLDIDDEAFDDLIID